MKKVELKQQIMALTKEYYKEVYIGCVQLAKLDGIVEACRRHFDYLYNALKGTPGLILPEPTFHSNPSWFGFLITVKPNAGFTCNELSVYLENRKIQTHNLFAGNLVKHPAFDEMLVFMAESTRVFVASKCKR